MYGVWLSLDGEHGDEEKIESGKVKRGTIMEGRRERSRDPISALFEESDTWFHVM